MISDTLSKMAVALPPMRSLRDFLTDAQFSSSTFNNMDRMNNRIIKNLIYYQSNYILTVIVIFLLVGYVYQDLHRVWVCNMDDGEFEFVYH